MYEYMYVCMYLRINVCMHSCIIGNMNSGEVDFKGHNEEIHSRRRNEGSNFQGIRSGSNSNVSSSSSSSQQIGGRHNGNHIYLIFHFVLSCMNVCMFVCIYVSMYVCTHDS